LSGFPDSTFYIHKRQIILAYGDKKLCQVNFVPQLPENAVLTFLKKMVF